VGHSWPGSKQTLAPPGTPLLVAPHAITGDSPNGCAGSTRAETGLQVSFYANYSMFSMANRPGGLVGRVGKGAVRRADAMLTLSPQRVGLASLSPPYKYWIASSLSLLAMTNRQD
jgi:hypothetical protein